VRLARRDVRDHIKYSKTGCWRSYRFYRASQRLKSPTCIICEILEARDFRVFQHNPPKAVPRHSERFRKKQIINSGSAANLPATFRIPLDII
jgi:hypothetical protein